MVNLETDLASISAPDSERRSEQDIYKSFFIKDMSAQISTKFDWLKFINNLLSVTEGDLQFTEDDKIVVYATDYLKNFFVTVKDKYTKA